MARRNYKPEEIIAKLREAEIHLASGKSVREAARKISVSVATFTKWRREYGGMQIDKVKQLKELQKENARLKKVVAELALDKAILNEAISGNY
jgi:transposase-like protein